MKAKKIIIAGGSGFLGQSLKRYLVARGMQIITLTRNPGYEDEILWDGQHLGAWCEELEEALAVINLCGKSVDCRYTQKNKDLILQSRIAPTTILNEAIKLAKIKPQVFINASSATVYIHAENEQMTERAGILGDDFSMNVVKAWEAAFFKEDIAEVRKIALRTSIVLGAEGGAWPQLKKIIKLGLGGQQGSGNQKVSWIHELDFCRSIEHIITCKALEGPVNITAPKPISNKDFMQHLRDVIQPLFYLNQPKVLLELGAYFLRTETELLLKSRNVVPEKLLKSKFDFEYPNLKSIDLNALTKDKEQQQPLMSSYQVI